MIEYPYILKTGSLRDFLKELPSRGVPEKITQSYLESIGYKSRHDRPIIKVLKFVGFLDSKGQTTDKYIKFRGKEAATIMATQVQSAYHELYQTYLDAHNKDKETLKNFFASKTTVGEPALTSIVNTYKVLCEFANFEKPIKGAIPLTTVTEPPVSSVITTSPRGIVLNLNIQLELPVTEDESVYDKIFRSLRKHLLE